MLQGCDDLVILLFREIRCLCLLESLVYRYLGQLSAGWYLRLFTVEVVGSSGRMIDDDDGGVD